MMNDERKEGMNPPSFNFHRPTLIIHRFLFLPFIVHRSSFIVFLAVCVWVLTWTAPLLSAFGFEKLSFLNYLAFHAACHQNPDRSFWISGAPMAVCARCSGLYAGALLGLALSASDRIRQAWTERLSRRRLALWCLPLVGDVAFHAAFRLPDPAPMRAATGLLAGATLFLFLGIRLFSEARQPRVEHGHEISTLPS